MEGYFKKAFIFNNNPRSVEKAVLDREFLKNEKKYITLKKDSAEKMKSCWLKKYEIKHNILFF